MTTPYGDFPGHDLVSWDWVPHHSVPRSKHPLTIWLFSSEIPPYPRGGLGRHVDRLARYLVYRGHQVQIVVPYPPGPGPAVAGIQRESPLPYVVWDIEGLPITLPGTSRPSVVHVHDATLWPRAQHFAERHGLPLLMTWHTLYGAWAQSLSIEPDPEWVERERSIFRESPHQIWVSRALFEQGRALYGAPEPTTSHRVIGSGISFPTVDSGVRLQRGFPDLLFFGRLEPEKGIDWLFTVLPDLLRRRRDLHVVICGNGSRRPTILQLIREQGWQKRVHAVGIVGDSELNHYLMTAKVAVLPSRFEPFGLTALEAMAMGLATIIGPAQGVLDFAVPGENCLRVKSPDQLIETIEFLLDHPERRQELGDAAQQLAIPWHWSQIGHEVERAYYDAQRKTPTIE